MTWQEAWRKLQSQFNTKGLTALVRALRNPDGTVLRGETVLTHSECDDPCLAACPIGYCGWHGEELSTDREVSHFFHRFSDTPEGTRFVNLFDEQLVPWEGLAAEIDAELDRRGEAMPIIV